MSYPAWLLALSAAFALLERLRPGRQSPRREWLADLLHLFVNSHAWGVLVAMTVGRYLPSWDTGLAAAWPFAAQAAVLAVVQDFAQW